MLTQRQLERSSQIVAEFTQWTPETGPCPISINDRHWFKKVCAMAERQAVLEDELGLLVTEAEKATEVEARRKWLIEEWITFGGGALLLAGMGLWNVLISLGKLPMVIEWPYSGMLMMAVPFAWVFFWVLVRANQSEKAYKQAEREARLTSHK